MTNMSGGATEACFAAVCPKAIEPCDWCACGVPREEMAKHRAVCNARRTTCEFCRETMTIGALPSHKAVCPMRPEQCRFCNAALQHFGVAEHEAERVFLIASEHADGLCRSERCHIGSRPFRWAIPGSIVARRRSLSACFREKTIHARGECPARLVHCEFCGEQLRSPRIAPLVPLS